MHFIIELILSKKKHSDQYPVSNVCVLLVNLEAILNMHALCGNAGLSKASLS